MEEQINGYNIISTLGNGSYGEVYLCEKKNNDENDNKKYAVKRLYQNVENFEGDFLYEIENMSKISSNYVVKYIEHFQVKNKYYIVMEYCEGGTLFDYIFKKRIFSK